MSGNRYTPEFRAHCLCEFRDFCSKAKLSVRQVAGLIGVSVAQAHSLLTKTKAIRDATVDKMILSGALDEGGKQNARWRGRLSIGKLKRKELASKRPCADYLGVVPEFCQQVFHAAAFGGAFRVAQDMGVTIDTVAHWADGKAIPTPENLVKLVQKGYVKRSVAAPMLDVIYPLLPGGRWSHVNRGMLDTEEP